MECVDCVDGDGEREDDEESIATFRRFATRTVSFSSWLFSSSSSPFGLLCFDDPSADGLCGRALGVNIKSELASWLRICWGENMADDDEADEDVNTFGILEPVEAAALARMDGESGGKG